MTLVFNMVLFVEIAKYFMWTSFFVSVPVNVKFIDIMETAGSEAMGNYRILMYGHSVNLLALSFLQAYCQPIISIEKSVVYVFSAHNYFGLSENIVQLLMAAYGASYCMAQVLCTAMFWYRYNRVCKNPGNADKTCAIWNIYALVGISGAAWGACIYYVAAETPYVDRIIEEPLRTYYGVNLASTTYVAAVYEVYNPVTRTVEFNKASLSMGCLFIGIILSSMLTIFYCGWQLWKKAKSYTGTSPAENIQKQLLRAQCIQVTIPIVLVLLPIGGVLILPWFQLNGNACFSVVSLLVSLYPILDPIAFLIVITRFREAFCDSIRTLLRLTCFRRYAKKGPCVLYVDEIQKH